MKTAQRLARRAWFVTDRFDVRSTLPAAIREIMQNGLLDRVFQDALIPEFLFPGLADSRPWNAGLGDTGIFTRTGLMAPQETPVTGSDAAVDTYGIEQWSMTMDQYGKGIDTNMMQSSMTLSSKFLEDQQKLAINAGQSLNRIARNKLFKAYAGGRTWATAAATTDTSIIVASTDGFETVLVNGKPTAVSASNPLPVHIAGVANTVTGVNVGTLTLTLGTTRVDVVGDDVVADNAPVSYRPAARATAYQVLSTDLATLALFRNAVARLRQQNVPTIAGAYQAHIDPTTENELFGDADFKSAYQGRGDSPIMQNFSLGRFMGIDWIRNNETPTVVGAGGLVVHRPIVHGAGFLVSGPFEKMGSLLAELSGDAQEQISMIGPANGVQVARIIREPLDRFQQVVGSAWSYIGDFAVPSDSVAGDASLYKRAVVIEHA